MKTRRVLWTLPLLSLGLVPTQALAQGQLTAILGEVGYQVPTNGFMRWTSGLLVGCGYCESSNPILWATDSQGNRESIAFSFPGADVITVRDVASGPDRSLAAVGLAISGNSRMGTFIAWISPDRSSQTITRVWPFAPNVVTVAPDGTIWTVGAVVNSNYRGNAYDNVLRHYTPSGQLLASTILQSVRPLANGFPEVSDLSALLASNDRIGWLTSSCQYLEFSFDAVELGRYPCPNGYSKLGNLAGFALSSGDYLLVGSKWLAPLAPLELNRAAGTWTPVPVSQDSGKTWKILGFDGTTLVTSSTNLTMRRYSWSGQAATVGQ